MRKSLPNRCLLIPHIKIPGPEQMALDKMLLEKSLEKEQSFSILRFYSWEGTWLSIGRNQKHLPARWAELQAEGKFKIVRRPSGGSAVLHKGGLTYCFIWPNAPKNRHLAYLQACQWLKKSFQKLDLSLKFGDKAQNLENRNCFSTSTKADLIDLNGDKRIGSAQYWESGHLLQHGEIVLNPPTDLWEEVFDQKAPLPLLNNSITPNYLEEILTSSFKSCWPKWDFHSYLLSEKELNQIKLKSINYLPID